MEKKNTVLLTVIAVATLLVAVVGATFAYFTASTAGTGTGQVNTSTTTTTGSVAVTLKDIANAGDVKYPGGVLVNGAEVETKVTGTGSFTGTYKVKGTVTITGMASANTTIKATMYKTTSKISTGLTTGCTMQTGTATGSEGTTITTYFYPDTCKAHADILAGSDVVATKTATLTDGAGTIDLTTADQAFTSVTNAATDNQYYYIVVEYVNSADAAQNEDFGGSVTAQFVGVTDAKSAAAAQ